MNLLKILIKQKPEDWERVYINSLTIKMLIVATLGTLGATVLAVILRKFAIGDINPEILFIPWGIVMVLGVSTSFHQGVLAERARQRQQRQQKQPEAEAKPEQKKQK